MANVAGKQISNAGESRSPIGSLQPTEPPSTSSQTLPATTPPSRKPKDPVPIPDPLYWSEGYRGGINTMGKVRIYHTVLGMGELTNHSREPETVLCPWVQTELQLAPLHLGSTATKANRENLGPCTAPIFRRIPAITAQNAEESRYHQIRNRKMSGHIHNLHLVNSLSILVGEV